MSASIRSLQVTAVAALAGLVAAAALLMAAPAKAWLWSPSVTLNGSISCPAWGGPFDRVQWAWVSPTRSSAGWAALSGTGWSRQYQFTLNNVPAFGSEQVTIAYGCTATGTHSTAFGVNRPKVGSYQTRNIY